MKANGFCRVKGQSVKDVGSKSNRATLLCSVLKHAMQQWGFSIGAWGWKWTTPTGSRRRVLNLARITLMVTSILQFHLLQAMKWSLSEAESQWIHPWASKHPHWDLRAWSEAHSDPRAKARCAAWLLVQITCLKPTENSWQHHHKTCSVVQIDRN